MRFRVGFSCIPIVLALLLIGSTVQRGLSGEFVFGWFEGFVCVWLFVVSIGLSYTWFPGDYEVFRK